MLTALLPSLAGSDNVDSLDTLENGIWICRKCGWTTPNHNEKYPQQLVIPGDKGEE